LGLPASQVLRVRQPRRPSTQSHRAAPEPVVEAARFLPHRLGSVGLHSAHSVTRIDEGIVSSVMDHSPKAFVRRCRAAQLSFESFDHIADLLNIKEVLLSPPGWSSPCHAEPGACCACGTN
jgi:hypothetical protein